MNGKRPLDAVSARLVQGIPCLHVRAQILLADRIEGDISGFKEGTGMDLASFGHDQRDAGIDLMGPICQHGKHIIGF